MYLKISVMNEFFNPKVGLRALFSGERLSKHAQDSIIFGWVKYAFQTGRAIDRYHWYHAPFDGNVIAGAQEFLEYVRMCK
jgi:hypothetical protein